MLVLVMNAVVERAPRWSMIRLMGPARQFGIDDESAARKNIYSVYTSVPRPRLPPRPAAR